MENFYSHSLRKRVQKISKSRARLLFNKGRTIYMQSSKMSFDNVWQAPCLAIKSEVSSWYNFDMICNDYLYYNCDAERGKRISFYVEA